MKSWDIFYLSHIWVISKRRTIIIGRLIKQNYITKIKMLINGPGCPGCCFGFKEHVVPWALCFDKVGLQSFNPLRQWSNCCSFILCNKASLEYDIPSVKLLEISNKQSGRNQSPFLSVFSEFQGFLGGYKIECDHQFKTVVQWQDRRKTGIMSYH